MTRSLTVLALVMLVCTGVSLGASVERIGPDEMRIRLSYRLTDFTFEAAGGYDYVRGSDVVYLPDEGVPGLPRRTHSLVIPWNSRVRSVEARPASEIVLDGTYRIVPTQPPTILGQNQARWVEGRRDIYAQDMPYPYDLIGGVHDGFMGSNRILSFNVSPFRWNPVSGRLVLCDEVLVTVSLEPCEVSRPLHRGGEASPALRRMVERAVCNPEDVLGLAQGDASYSSMGMSMLGAGDYEYVVVTPDSMVAAYQPLIDWKNEKGIPAICVTREWIEATYPGSDSAEQIRNFVIDAYETWGTVWLLMGGDTRVVPSRTVYAMDCEMGGTAGNRIRCDLYFADLDGDWNANGITPYGEVADSVDMYPDLFVGRAPAENIAEAVVFVDKVLTYEQSPPSGNALEMLMAGEIMWSDPYTDGGVGLDMIDEDCVPARFDPILKLYQSLGNESPETVLGAMSAGQNYVIHDGHCNEYVMGAGEGYIYYTDADTLSNGDRTFILNSIGCWPAAIDRDCIAEHFMNNPNGGCVAFIGNSRYGWGSPGNPGFGYSDKFQYEFVKAALMEGDFCIGEAHADSKIEFIDFAQGENVYRWNEYQLNLLGDPEMPLWTDEPEALTVSAPASIMGAGDVVRIGVEDASGALEGALVCIMNGTDVYMRERTDISGTVTFNVTTAAPESLLVTVTAFDHLPHQERLEVVAAGALLSWTGAVVIDGGDGMSNPGETFELEVTVKNFGTEPDSGVWGILRTADSLCTVEDSVVYYGEVAAGGETSGDSRYQATISVDACDRDVIIFELVLEDSTSAEWVCRLPLTVAHPVMRVASYGIDDRTNGDGDWVVEPGETVQVTWEVVNDGLTYGEGLVSSSTADPYLSTTGGLLSAGTLQPGEAGYCVEDIVVSELCPEHHVGRIDMVVTASGDSGHMEAQYFTVGDLAFADNCEAGEGVWTHTGTPDLWHLSSYRSHSDSMSWYFGNEAGHSYPSDADGSVVSQDFIAGEYNRYSFWFWYDFTTYGTDGVYVIVHTNGVPDTLDFIGSGGALDGTGALNIASGWVKWERLIEQVLPGDTLTFEFGFISDELDVAEGMYIDDISFTCKTPVLTGVPDLPGPGLASGISIFPNPAQSRLTMAFPERHEKLAVDIFTIRGRFVASLEKPWGATAVEWDLSDADGRRVAPGIYLASVRDDAYACSRKIVVLK